MKGGCLARGVPHSACQIILLVGISYSESGQLPSATEFDLPLFLLKLELAKYYKDSEMTAYISERSRNSK